MKYLPSILLFLLVFVQSSFSYRILVLNGLSSPSHMNVFWPIIDGLQSRGHQVTVISSSIDVKNHPKVKQIELTRTKEYIIDFGSRMVEVMKGGLLGYAKLEVEMMTKLPEQFFADPAVQQLIKDKPHYDLILTDSLYNEYVLPVAHWLNAPFIFVCTAYLDTWAAYVMNVPNPFSYVPSLASNLPTKMNFTQRMKNSLINLGFLYVGKQRGVNAQSIVDQHLPGVPSIDEIRQRLSMIIVNSDPVMDVPRPSLPNVIRVGGIHCLPPKPLPKDLEDFVAGSRDDGFILLSLGSVLKGDFLPKNAKEGFIEAFSQLKQRVLWKSDQNIEGLSNNVKVVKWLPQQDVLGHPKIRLFITHSGLLSMQESVYHAVPTIGVPVFADQGQNSARAKDLGFGESIDLFSTNTADILSKINRILNDSRYKENALKYSTIFKDREGPLVDKAVYWTEYAIRHQGADHLLTPANDLSFIQYFLIDVLLFVAAVILTIAAILVLFIKFVCSRIRNSKAKKD